MDERTINHGIVTSDMLCPTCGYAHMGAPFSCDAGKKCQACGTIGNHYCPADVGGE